MELRAGNITVGDINDAVSVEIVLSSDKAAIIEWLYPGSRKAMEEKLKAEAEEKRFEQDWAALMSLSNLPEQDNG